jgi:hypothetical protein
MRKDDSNSRVGGLLDLAQGLGHGIDPGWIQPAKGLPKGCLIERSHPGVQFATLRCHHDLPRPPVCAVLKSPYPSECLHPIDQVGRAGCVDDQRFCQVRGAHATRVGQQVKHVELHRTDSVGFKEATRLADELISRGNNRCDQSADVLVYNNMNSDIRNSK